MNDSTNLVINLILVKMEMFIEHMRHAMFYEFRKDKKVAKIFIMLTGYNHKVKETAENGLEGFRKTDFNIWDVLQTGSSVVFNEDLFLFELNRNSVIMVEKIDQKLNSTYSIVHCHLQLFRKNT